MRQSRNQNLYFLDRITGLTGLEKDPYHVNPVILSKKIRS